MLSGAKSDAGDAAVIAEYLRLRAHKLKAAAPYSDETLSLRTVVRARGTWSRCGSRPPTSCRRCCTRTGLREGSLRRRRVRDQPGVPDPLPDPGRRCSPGREADGLVLRQARLLRPPHRRRAARPPAGRAAGGRLRSLAEALRDAVVAAVGVLTSLNASVKSLDRSVSAHLGEHPDGATSRRCQGRVRSTPPRYSPSGATAAKPRRALLRRRPRRRHPGHLESGKHRAVHFRCACNK